MTKVKIVYSSKSGKNHIAVAYTEKFGIVSELGSGWIATTEPMEKGKVIDLDADTKVSTRMEESVDKEGVLTTWKKLIIS